MRVYKYQNATVYITEPTEEHLKRIKKATEVFLKRVVKERVKGESRGYNRGINNGNPGTRKRNQPTKAKNKKY